MRDGNNQNAVVFGAIDEREGKTPQKKQSMSVIVPGKRPWRGGNLL